VGFLSGVRVVSFTTGIAGPNAARILAQCGAEVFKIESKHGGLDNFRFFGTDADLDSAPRFIESNLNVLSVQINLKHPIGPRLARELIAKSDVVLDNFRPEVMPRLGLGPDELRRMKPELIVARMPGLGLSGPNCWYGTWGSTLTAFSGMTYLWNHPGQARPIGAQGVYPDYVSAALLPALIVAALMRRRATGEGATLELAQVEATAYMLGVNLLETAVNRREPTPMGNGSPNYAPHNCYPCKGDDRWCVIAVENDQQWRTLACILGRSDLADHDLAARRERLTEIDELVACWTRERDAHEVMRTLQQAGVPAGVVQTAADLFNDPHLRARGFISGIDHPTLGHMPLAALPLHIADGGIDEMRCADMLGEHTEYAICDLLGYTRAQLARWREEQVLE
jgi:benzylsuccinate CoA-transferase BbsF subunit